MTEEEAKKAGEWFDRLIKGNYKRVTAEILGKMMLALEKMAKEKSLPFTDFIEGISREARNRLEKGGLGDKSYKTLLAT